MSLFNPFNNQIFNFESGVSFNDFTFIANSIKDRQYFLNVTTLAGICANVKIARAQGITFYWDALNKVRSEKITNQLNVFFGPTGPGYNYSGATSNSYFNAQLNNKTCSEKELTFNRILHALHTQGFTSGTAYLANYFKTLNIQDSKGAQLPGTIPINLI